MKLFSQDGYGKQHVYIYKIYLHTSNIEKDVDVQWLYGGGAEVKRTPKSQSDVGVVLAAFAVVVVELINLFF